MVSTQSKWNILKSEVKGKKISLQLSPLWHATSVLLWRLLKPTRNTLFPLPSAWQLNLATKWPTSQRSNSVHCLWVWKKTLHLIELVQWWRSLGCAKLAARMDTARWTRTIVRVSRSTRRATMARRSSVASWRRMLPLCVMGVSLPLSVWRRPTTATTVRVSRTYCGRARLTTFFASGAYRDGVCVCGLEPACIFNCDPEPMTKIW